MLESAEFKLLIALTHPSVDQQPKLITDIIDGHSIDWDIFLKLVDWHRVTPQVSRNLSAHQDRLPEPILQQLHQATMMSQCKSLQQSAWLVKIVQLFNKNQIRFINLKGVALSQLLYADSGRRQSKDLDILIDQADLAIAEQLLTEILGFTRLHPAADATPAEINYSNLCSKDRIYQHARDKTEVEVHWRFVIEPPILAVSFPELYKHSLPLQFHQQTIAVLDYNHLWLYQSLHGTHSGWYRLHWISDIAELLVSHQPDWDSLLKMADVYHCKKCLIEAVTLAGQIYQLPIPETIHFQMQKTWQQPLSIPLVLQMLSKTQIRSPYIALLRTLFWLPKKYYFLQLLLKMGQISRGSADGYRQQPDRVIRYYLLRPVAFVIRRLLTHYYRQQN